MTLKLFELEAVVGLDDSAYRKAIQNIQSDTKKTIATLSGEYSKASKSVAELSQKYNDSVSKTGKASKETKELKAQLSAAQAQLRTTTAALKAANTSMAGFGDSAKSTGTSLSSAFAKGQMLGNVLTSLASKALSAAESFVQTGIDYNAQIEKYTTGFTNMLGSAEAAQQAMDAIQEDAARTPFNVEALTQANQLLISAGENAGYSRKVIMALGNAVSATGGGNDELSRMAANLQQIANVGKAASIDIKQFAYAGINIYQILADYTGKTVQEVQSMTISYDTLSQALIAASEEGGRYYNAMDTQSQTMNGRVSTLQDNVKQLAGLMTGDLSDGIGIVIGNLNDLVVKAQEAYKTDGWIGLAGAITGLSDPINSAKSKFGEFASAAATWLDQLSYKLNRFLGKTATADFDTYEEYAADQQKQQNRNRLRQNALKGIGISNKSWTERQAELAAAAGDGDSSITGGGGGDTSGKKSGTKSTTETVIASVSNTITTSAQNALGAVTTSVETLNEKVKDSAGKIKDRVTTTTTETGKEMVNGVATSYKQVETKVNGVVTKVTKTYDDMSKTLTDTLTRVSETTVAGVTTKVQEVTEKYADGSEHIKRTETETGKHIVNGVAETYEKVITYIDGIKDKVTETANVVDKSVKGTQSRIEQQLSEASGELNTGFFGLVKSMFSDLQSGSWGNLGLDFVNLIWGEVSQDQRDVLSNWAQDALSAINESYSGGGVSAALDSIKKLFTEGITPGAEQATSAVASFGKVLEGLSASGGAGGVLAGIGTQLSGIVSTIVSFVSSNPWVLAILAVVAGVAGLGGFLWNKYGKSDGSSDSSSSDAVSSSKLSYKDIQDAYWYGNERAFAGYDFRTDPYTFNPTNSLVNQYQEKIQTQLTKLSAVVEEYLPEVANTQLVLDDGTLVGAMAPGMNDQLGQLQLLAERGN